MSEIWASIGCSQFYEVSNLGNVRSLKRLVVYKNGKRRIHGGAILRQIQKSTGYKVVSIYVRENGVRKLKQSYVHRLVIEAFVGPCKDGTIVCHNDGNRSNNALHNLRYGTPKSNSMDAVNHGTMPHGETHPNAILSERQATEIFLSKESASFLASKYGVSKQSVKGIRAGRTWKKLPVRKIKQQTPISGSAAIRTRMHQ